MIEMYEKVEIFVSSNLIAKSWPNIQCNWEIDKTLKNDFYPEINTLKIRLKHICVILLFNISPTN